ncbi:hypothetical protein O181_018254 [Austropuccinia psidii MF-1]|uniref:Uncharacterized protein n=1 Tax=Austropuccinia psidii MF-1 TaxID=1389203 RepID=A0A9Q3GTL0_9BASI|nr:hypothetical protein [Austropuccinia psidii MF-1]
MSVVMSTVIAILLDSKYSKTLIVWSTDHTDHQGNSIAPAPESAHKESWTRCRINHERLLQRLHSQAGMVLFTLLSRSRGLHWINRGSVSWPAPGGGSAILEDDPVPPSSVTFAASCRKQGAIRPMQWRQSLVDKTHQLTHHRLGHWRDDGDSLDETWIVAARAMRFGMSHVSPLSDYDQTWTGRNSIPG